MSTAIRTNCPTLLEHGTVALQYVQWAWFEDLNPPEMRFVRVAVFLPVTGTRIIQRDFAGVIVMDWTLVEHGSEIRFYRADGGGCVFRIV